LGSLIQTNISHKVVPTSNIGCIASSDLRSTLVLLKLLWRIVRFTFSCDLFRF